MAVAGGHRALWLFVIVLAWSRAMWGEFVLDLSVHSLCRSLVRAACFFGGVTRQWLFDNPKIVVLERHGDAVRFHPLLLELCGRMLVQPRLCAVAHPEHKGRVERSIRYLRERFLAGRTIVSVPQGNEALLSFLSEIADARPHPRLPGLTVAQAFEQERTRLLSLPDVLPPTDLVTPVRVDKTAFVRLDTNLYSAPPAYAGGMESAGRVAAPAGGVQGKRPKQTWAVAARPLTPPPDAAGRAITPRCRGIAALAIGEPGDENSE